jgi:two-component system LytT family response regulator
LLKHFPGITITGEASSCQSASELINLSNPHLVFLDIHLRGETCFDFLDLIDKSIKVFFVTAFDENALTISN